MKYLSLIMILSLSLSAGEIDRMEAMVADIEKLRNSYSECKKELDKQILNNILPFGELENSLKRDISEKNRTINDYKKRLNKEKIKNNTLLAEIDLLKKEHKTDKLVNNLKKVLETKAKDVFSLKNEIIRLNKIIENNDNNLILAKNNDVKCVEDNQFPKLIMKDSIKEKSITDKKIPTIIKEDSSEVPKEIKASAFRLKVDADIYDSIDGNIIDNWENGRSFTSNIMSNNWLKITGYFNAGQWGRANEELWIKKINVLKR